MGWLKGLFTPVAPMPTKADVERAHARRMEVWHAANEGGVEGALKAQALERRIAAEEPGYWMGPTGSGDHRGPTGGYYGR